MLIYLIIIILLLLLSYFYDLKNKKRNKNFWYFFLLFLFIIIAGVRYRIGGDTIIYMRMYSDIPEFSDLIYGNYSFTTEDPLWIFFCSFLRIFSKDFVLLQLTIAAIVNTSVFLFIKRFSRFVFSSLLLYFCLFYLNLNTEIIRESLAISLFLYAVAFYVNRKWLKYYIIAVIAFLFHSSAIILFFLPLFMNFKSRKFSFYRLLIIMIVGALIVKSIEILGAYLMFSDRLAYKTSNYLNNEYYSSGLENINAFLFQIITFAIFPLGIILYNHLNKINKEHGLLPFMFPFIIVGFFTGFLPILYRFNNYLFLIFIIFCADFFLNFVVRNFNYPKALPFFSLCLCFIYLNIFPLFRPVNTDSRGIIPFNRYYPYSSVFFEEKNQNREWLSRNYEL